MGLNLPKLLTARPASRPDRLLITLPFYALFLAQIAHHEVWRDEINAWAISYVSTSIPDLLHRVHYEAHPALWYILLFAASRFSHAVWMLKLVEVIIATGSYFVLAWAAPFRRIELILILAGYYFAFEYTVLCRMYGIELMVALAYAWLRSKHPDWIFRNALCLGIIANVDITGAILAGALLVEYCLDRLTQTASTSRQKVREVSTILLTFFAAFAIAIETLWPAKDLGWSTTGKMFSHFWESGHLVQSAIFWVTVPWLPKSINIVAEWELNTWTYFWLTPPLLFLLYLIFRPHWKQAVMMATVIVTGILFTHIISVAGVRHTGIVYIAFLVALWILRVQNARVSPLAYVLLALTAVTGIIATIDQWSWPFTDTEEAAQWIRQQHLENTPLFVTPDTHMLGVPERLNRPFYQLECHCIDNVLRFSSRRDAFDAITDIPASLIRGFREEHVQTGLFLINRPLDGYQLKQLSDGGLDHDLIAHFTHGFLGDEYVYIYRLTITPGNPQRLPNL